MRGLGYRLYDTAPFWCSLCKSHFPAVFILGWGNWMRCANCLMKLFERRHVEGMCYQYMRGSVVIREGVE